MYLISILILLFVFEAQGHFDSLLDVIKENAFSKEESSDLCEVQKQAYYDGILNGTDWALQMLDASAKIPSGILIKNAFELGSFEECLDIEESTYNFTVKGNYCLYGLLIPYEEIISGLGNESGSGLIPNPTYDELKKMQIRIAQRQNRVGGQQVMPEGVLMLSMCIPDQCNPSDVFGSLGLDMSCQTKDLNKELDAGDISCIVFFCLITCTMIISTAYDIYLKRSGGSPIHPIFLAFSVYTNGRKIFSTVDTKNANQIVCFNGLKAISLLWVIAGHTMIYKATGNFVTNAKYSEEWQRKWYSVYILQAPLAVDTFLFVSGVLLSFNFLKTMQKPGAKFNIILYYVHRYIRLTPALAATFFVVVTVARKLGNGPFWPMMFDMSRQNCLDNWWSLFLYVQNYVAENTDMCLPHSWYLSMDMQIFLISPLILFPLLYYRKPTLLFLMPLLVFASILTPFLVLLLNNITYMSDDFNHLYYFYTHNRLSPWLIGLAFGVLALKLREKKIKMHWILNLCIWAIDFVIIGVIFFTQDDIVYNYDKWKTSFYYGSYRAAWSVCLCWIVFSCINGQGGIVNWFLSLPIFQVISKLSYSTYLVHYTIINIIAFHRTYKTAFSDLDAIYECLANAMFSIFVGIFWSLAFESPMITIEKFIFGEGAVKVNNKKRESAMGTEKNTKNEQDASQQQV